MGDRQDRLDRERMSRLLETADIVNYPAHILINGIKFWLEPIAKAQLGILPVEWLLM